jgi:hypothetical protein
VDELKAIEIATNIIFLNSLTKQEYKSITKEKFLEINPDYSIDEFDEVEKLIELTNETIEFLTSEGLTKSPSDICVIDVSNQDNDGSLWIYNQKHKLIDMSENLLQLASKIGYTKNNWYGDFDSEYIDEFFDTLGFKDISKETTTLEFYWY